MARTIVLALCLVVRIVRVQSGRSGTPSFGHEMLSQFSLEPGYTNLNHGGFGCAPIFVQEAANRYRALSEVNPDRFVNELKTPLLDKARQDIANYVGASDVKEVVLVENASSGINALLRSLRFNPGDKILILEDAYSMIRQTVEWLNFHSGVEIVLVSLHFPVQSDEDFLKCFRSVLEEHGSSIRAAVVEHTMSTPAVILPIAEIFALVREYTSGGRPPRGGHAASSNVYDDPAVCIGDGAHALGNFDVNPEETGSDAYVTNGHKWLYSVRGSTLLWVKESLHKLIVPTVVSSAAKVNPILNFVENFDWTGTRDYSSLISMSDALEFRRLMGGDQAIKGYMNELSRFGEEYLVNLWNTEVVDQRPGANLIGAFANVRLPFDDEETGKRVFDRIEAEFQTKAIRYMHSGRQWVRLSCQIYNEPSDIELFGQRVLKFMNESPEGRTISAKREKLVRGMF